MDEVKSKVQDNLRLVVYIPDPDVGVVDANAQDHSYGVEIFVEDQLKQEDEKSNTLVVF